MRARVLEHAGDDFFETGQVVGKLNARRRARLNSGGHRRSFLKRSYHTSMNPVTDDLEEPERPSKSQRKRDMAALQDLGAELVTLNADQLAQIELPERLYEAIVAAQRIRDFEGRRRQLQFIGKL